MNLQKILVPIGGVIIVVIAYRAYGWGGVALAAGGIFMWVMLNFTRMMKVLERAGQRPIGYVDSAVMLNAKLSRGMTLLHVVAMTRALGELLSEKDAQPETFRWTDSTRSHVTAEFLNGKLVKWEMVRPPQPEASPVPAPAPEPGPPGAP